MILETSEWMKSTNGLCLRCEPELEIMFRSSVVLRPLAKNVRKVKPVCMRTMRHAHNASFAP